MVEIGGRRVKHPIIENNMQEIMIDICTFLGVTPEDVKSRSRLKTLVVARTVFCVRARDEAKASLREIGNLLGRRPSSVICHYMRKYARRKKSFDMYKE